jgi:hypothetical protein
MKDLEKYRGNERIKFKNGMQKERAGYRNAYSVYTDDGAGWSTIQNLGDDGGANGWGCF